MTFLIPTQQVAIMFILMLIGWVCYKIKFIHEQTTKDLTSVLLYVVSPCLIINAFKQKLTITRLQQFFLLMIIITGLFIFKIVVSKAFFTKKRISDRGTRTILKYAGTYTNAGFMGIPLVQALLGSNGVFFAVPYLICYNIFMWTHGIGMFKKQEGSIADKIREIMLNPNIIAAIIGFLFFVTQLKLPQIIVQPMNYIADINTPLSMIVIGTNLGSINLKGDLKNKFVWWGIAARNIFFPLCVLGILWLIPLAHLAKLATLIMAACPVAGVVVLFSLISKFDVKFPTELMCLSTLFAIITLPLMIILGTILL